MTERPQFDPITPFCRDVIALFRETLPEVRFPELDRDRLEAEAAGASQAQLEVERLERELEDARQRAREAAARLTRSAEQALAYARVYAISQPVVLEALTAMEGPRPVLAETKAKKPRAPRAKKEEALLPIETEAAE